MPTRSSDRFPTIRTEGAILPADLLQRIAAGDSGLPGLTPSSYHLIEGEKLNEATNRAWNRLQSAWSSFRIAWDKLSATDLGVGTTRERWLLPLFQEFGYGRLQPLKDAFAVQDKYYPISHAWGHVPIHLVGCRMDLDKRAAGSPSSHSLVQEFLNRSEAHLWGFVSNGVKLRILRDNIRLTRQAYVEFDLQAMFDGKIYADFLLLWRLCNQSRVEAERPQDCWLEQWSKAAQQQGLRVLDQLRGGVEQAIAALGSGFLACPSNKQLRNRLRAGNLDAQDYYRQLLRLVYRLLFLFVAEDRELLFEPQASDTARDRYHRFYSLTRLRQQAERLRGTQHTDLYQMLSLVMAKLGSTTGCLELGLPALGSFLFSPEAVPELEGCQLTNADLLAAIRALSLTSDGQALRGVDYRNLGSEELGSIYESLLELHPVLNSEAATFELYSASGHERKTTGSYYTPTSLITCLLDSALDPVLDEAVRQPNAEAALLNLKVCDPASGSGHFLIAAAHRLAKRLAFVRTGEEEPPPDSVRMALRDVIGHCVYGVDINPMAVELCKVALWMEALVPGKPLSFLDHHIQCGNSLLGTTPALLATGIPDDAFEPIEGDDKALCRSFKRKNQDERRGQGDLFDRDLSWNRLADLAGAMHGLEQETDETVAGVQRKEERYSNLIRSSGYLFGRLWADAWCAAFVWRKDRTFDCAITEAIFRQIERSPATLMPSIRDEIQRLASQYEFFHWHLAFPDVFRVPSHEEKPENETTGWSGGFDVVLGNPPWERIKLQEQEWFTQRRPDIARAPAAKRRRMIAELADKDPALYRAFLDDRRRAEGESHLVRHSGRYPLCGRGDVNTYTLFAEMNRMFISSTGRVGCIVPSGIATDDTTKVFFQDLMQTRTLVSLFSFFEIRLLFPDTDSRNPFCLLTLAGPGHPAVQGTTFVFNARTTNDIADPERRFTLSESDLALLNPNTLTCPVFRSRRDAELTKSIYRRVPVLVRESRPQANSWGAYYLRLVDYSDHAQLLCTRERCHREGYEQHGNKWIKDARRCVPVSESKLINAYDHRFATYGPQDQVKEVEAAQHADPQFEVIPRYWVEEAFFSSLMTKYEYQPDWFLAYRDVARPTDTRTLIATAIPRFPASRKLPVLGFHEEGRRGTMLLANLNSFVTDYVVRQKMGGTSMGYFILKQLPVLPPATYDQETSWAGRIPLIAWLLPRVLELVYTAWDIQPFAVDCGYAGPPFRWDGDRRFLLRCELDATFFYLYGISRDDVGYVMDTFPVVKRKDEQQHGEYRTKRVILEMYDDLAEAVRTGQPYLTRLEPPPADLRMAHRPREVGPGPTHQQIQRMRVMSYIILLLRTWNRPVARAALEPAIVLMLNDTARQVILGQPRPEAIKHQHGRGTEYVKGLDGLLGEMQVSQFISSETIQGQQAFRVGAQAPATGNAPPTDVQKVRETLRALDQLGEDRALTELHEIVHETYDLVS
jgi:N-6 DNA Methylase